MATASKLRAAKQTGNADLTSADIASAPTEELVEVIASSYVFGQDVLERLRGYDRPTLERLAHLARLCRQQRQKLSQVDRA